MSKCLTGSIRQQSNTTKHTEKSLTGLTYQNEGNGVKCFSNYLKILVWIPIYYK